MLGASLVARRAEGRPKGEAPFGVPNTPAARPRIDPRAVAEARLQTTVPVLIYLRDADHVDSASTAMARAGDTRERLRAGDPRARLRAAASRTQPALVAWLRQHGADGVAGYTVDNIVRAEVDARTLAGLASQPSVTQVVREPVLGFDVAAAPDPPGRTVAAAPARVEPGVKAIGADAVWDMGYRGEGVVILVTDTGAAFRHPALKAAYRGADAGSDYNWLDPVDGAREPVDEDGHGTHVTGIAVGEAGARQIGVAPGARWIACRVGRTKAEGINGAAILACLDWALAPTRADGSDPRPDLAPDVIVASWTAGVGDSCTSSWLRGATDNLAAAGILFVTSAGNTGSTCNTVCNPGSYPGVVAVANYDSIVRRIHPTSSRGPVGELVKPDIAAPGTQITSSEPPAGYGTRTGTSMAAPALAGAAALLLSARPDLKPHPSAVVEALEAAAEPVDPDHCGPDDPALPNNSAGHGLVRIDHAVQTALVPTVTPTATATRTPTTAPTATATETTPEAWRLFLPRLYGASRVVAERSGAGEG